MDFLLAFNNEAALVGDMSGNVRKRHPSQLTAQAWENRLRFAYIEAERGGEEAEACRLRMPRGSFRFENGQVKVMKVEGVKPYETFR
jgi:hypothetical protein